MGLSLFLIACLVIFAHLWKIAAARIGALGLNPEQLLLYIAFNEWVLISLPDIQEDMEQDVRSGRLAYWLPRPISYLCALFFEGLGILCVNLFVLGVVAFSFTAVRIGGIPLSLDAFAIALLIGLGAGCVGLIFQMLVGISAFWFQQVGPFYWVWEKLLFTFGGLILPLSVYPLWLQKIGYLTPFSAILGGRSALVLDYRFGHVVSVLAALLFWAVCGTALLVFLYRKGLKIVHIEGG